MSVIETATDTVAATIPVALGPFGVAVHPDGTRVYVTNQVDDTVSVLDTATNTVTATITVGERPRGVAVHPDGATAYVKGRSARTPCNEHKHGNRVAGGVYRGVTLM